MANVLIAPSWSPEVVIVSSMYDSEHFEHVEEVWHAQAFHSVTDIGRIFVHGPNSL